MLTCFWSSSIDSITLFMDIFFLFLIILWASFLLWWYSCSSFSLLPFINHFSLAFYISSIANLHSSLYHLFLNVSVPGPLSALMSVITPLNLFLLKCGVFGSLSAGYHVSLCISLCGKVVLLTFKLLFMCTSVNHSEIW